MIFINLKVCDIYIELMKNYMKMDLISEKILTRVYILN